MTARCELLAAATILPDDRVRTRGGHRCAAQYDEDAVTLAAQAVIALRQDRLEPPSALIFATVTPPYEEGGCAQLVAEIAGLPSQLFTVELTATPRDGLAAVRLACGLICAGGGHVLVCASHRRRADGEREAGDGAVALLLGPPGAEGGIALLTPVHSHAEELRDRWRLPGDLAPREGDASFTDELGSTRVARLLAEARQAGEPGEEAPQPIVVASSSRAAGRLERALGGPGDQAFVRTGLLGCAHPLLRMLLCLGEPSLLLAASGGLGESLLVEPEAAGAALAAEVSGRVAAGREVDAVPPSPAALGFDPYASGPRAWRERGQDLRLEGVLRDGEILYPPPAGLQGPRQPLPRRGRVITHTFDYVYPGADGVQMVVLELEDGSRFYCQVLPGQRLQIDEEAQLLPRRLHEGGGMIQYFWKAAQCR